MAVSRRVSRRSVEMPSDQAGPPAMSAGRTAVIINDSSEKKCKEQGIKVREVRIFSGRPQGEFLRRSDATRGWVDLGVAIRRHPVPIGPFPRCGAAAGGKISSGRHGACAALICGSLDRRVCSKLGSPPIFRDLRKFCRLEGCTRISAQDLVVNFPAARANGPHRSDGRFDFRILSHGFAPEPCIRHGDE